MSQPWGDLRIVAALLGAALLFLLEVGFSIILGSLSTLSRVALRRLSTDSRGRLAFLEAMHDLSSSRRIAIGVARQLCLLGGTLLLILGARAAGWSWGIVIGVSVGAGAVAVVLDLMVAGAVAVWDPRSALRLSAFLVRPAHALLLPIVHPIHLLLRRIDRLPTGSEEEREEEQEEDVEAFIEVGEREGILEANEGEMMRSIVDLDETFVREIMTPRGDIVSLSVDATVEQARQKVLEAGHSRLPVFRENLDEVVGVLYVRDLLRAADATNGGRAVSEFMRDAMFVSESLSVAELLTNMRLKTQIALVVDEFGGVAGLVTLEDLLEEIVGDIHDEHDLEESMISEEDDGSWTINAAARVEELEELFGLDLGERDFDTVGGLVVSRLGRVPAVGETLEVGNLRIEVRKVERHRIRQVSIRQSGPAGRRRAES